MKNRILANITCDVNKQRYVNKFNIRPINIKRNILGVGIPTPKTYAVIVKYAISMANELNDVSSSDMKSILPEYAKLVSDIEKHLLNITHNDKDKVSAICKPLHIVLNGFKDKDTYAKKKE